jgi:hypothetical protein
VAVRLEIGDTVTFTDDPAWIDGLTYSGAEMRRAASMGHMANGVAGGSIGGVRPGDPGLKVTLSGMSISVAAGVAAVPYAGQGVYRAYNNTTWSGTVNTADPSLTRIDLVYLRVWDNAVDAGGNTKADIVYITGSPGAGVAPTPGGTVIYIPLAQITVPAGSTTPSVTDLRGAAVAPGGIAPAGALGMATGYYAGQYRDNPTTGLLERYDGAGTWGAPEQPMVGVINTSASLASHATNYFAISWSGTTSSNRGGQWAAGNPTRVQALYAGTYELAGNIIWPGTLGSAIGRAEVRLNGTGTSSNTARFNTMYGSSGNSAAVIAGSVIFTAPGYLEVYANQNSGTTITALIASLTMRRVSSATS